MLVGTCNGVVFSITAFIVARVPWRWSQFHFPPTPEFRRLCNRVVAFPKRLQVMYNQMLAWILHGTLVDQHGEFFIAQTRLAISSDLDARDILQHFHGGGGSSTSNFSSEGGGVSSDKNMLRREFDWRSRQVF